MSLLWEACTPGDEAWPLAHLPTLASRLPSCLIIIYAPFLLLVAIANEIFLLC